jgi:phosphofructokinase-like protein
MRIGVLTSGGDCPGLNAVIRSVVHRAVVDHGDSVIGVLDGYLGLIEGRGRPLGLDDVRGILTRGGTILGSARVEHSRVFDGVERADELQAALGIDALIVIGGDGTLTAAHLFSTAGLPVVSVPKTIDNDVSATDTTLGHDTAVHIATEAIDRLKTTAETRHQVMVVELMGRHTGWIALHAGMAAGAHGILIPERPFDVEEVCLMVERRFSRGKTFAIVAVAEGSTPAQGTMRFEHGDRDIYGHQRFNGIGPRLASEIAQWLAKDAAPVVLGHVQRGGTPTARDRVLATRFGWHAVEAVHAGAFGQMASLHRTDIRLVPIEEAIARSNPVTEDQVIEAAAVLGQPDPVRLRSG